MGDADHCDGEEQDSPAVEGVPSLVFAAPTGGEGDDAVVDGD